MKSHPMAACLMAVTASQLPEGVATGRAHGTRPHFVEVPKALNATPYNKGKEAERRRKRMKAAVAVDWRQDELAVVSRLGELPPDVSQAVEDAVLRSFGIEHGRKEAFLSQLLRGPEAPQAVEEAALLAGAEALCKAYYAQGTNQVKKG
jgi:hypothetical protein